MKKILFALLLAAPLQAQTPDMDRYAEQFYGGAEPGPQNFVLPSLEEMLMAKAFLFQLEILSLEISGVSPIPALKDYGSPLYTEFTNYTKQYGRSTCSPAFLVQLANLRIRLMSYKPLAETIPLSELSKEDFDMALKKDPTYFPAYLGMAQWYLSTPVIGGDSTRVAEEYLVKAKTFAKQPHQKYQTHVWQAVLYNKSKKYDLAAQEIAAAALIYPNGKLHTYISQKNSNKI